MNPLLEDLHLPAFDRIRPEHVEPAIDQRLAEGRALIARLSDAADDATWDGFVEAIEEEDDRLARTWAPVSHLNAVVNSDELRAAYNACLPKLSEYASEVGQNPDVYRAYRRISEQPGLNAAQRKMLSNTLRDLHLAGVDLPADQQARFREINQALSRLSSKYEENLLDATSAWIKHIKEPSDLEGLPESALALAHANAKERGLDGWVITLDVPSYLPVMKYAEDRGLRREVYEAYVTRASDQGPNAGTWDNSPIMEEILSLRHERAAILGFPSYADLSVANKMAKDTNAVLAFLNDLATRAVPRAREELDEVRAFAKAQGCAEPLAAWDQPFWSERLRQRRYAISDEALKPYFPLDRVLSGMFSVAERLFAIQIKPGPSVSTWHPHVRFYQVNDADGEIRAYFYLDAYARRKKRGGAWMDACANRMRSQRRLQLPVAHLVCNFTPPVEGRPPLMTHTEVETLFHEFGHALQHMLTRVDYPPIAGINGVPWDAVELPSQFMENWCWERESLDLFARHWETDTRIPEELYHRMRAAKNFQSATQLARQLEFALFDFRIHLDYQPHRPGQVAEVIQQVREKVGVLEPPDYNRFAHGFSHIFAGGYAAGYYSYKWAEVLSADAFSLFEERGIFDRETGTAFLTTVLEQGGSDDAMTIFADFRGRKPKIDALLRHSGIAP